MPAIARRLGYLAFAAGRASGGSRADVVMTRDLAVAALLLRLPSRPPIVYESHGYAPDLASGLPTMISTAAPPSEAKLARLARREAYVWSRADGYVTITAGLRDELTRRFGTRPRVAVVHDGARIAARPSSPASSSDSVSRVVVGYAGHLYAWKGVDALVEALARIPNAAGLIVGGHEKEPDLARVRALAAARGIADRVTFTGHVPPSDVASHLARADVLVLPNPESPIATHATSPLKLFEYMAARKAIVASDLPSIREVLSHDVNAILVKPGDADAIASAIRTLAGDRALRERLAASACEAGASYSWARRAERLDALFGEVLASRGSRAS
jgi:glycosyltransferase involved in cell wall biosynthesis